VSPIGSLFGSFSADAGARAKPTPSSPLIWELLCVETSASHGLVGVKSTGSKSDSDAQSFVDSERIPTKGKCAQVISKKHISITMPRVRRQQQDHVTSSNTRAVEIREP